MRNGTVPSRREHVMKLGEMQTLKILRFREFGAYLGADGEEESVLLPKKEVPEGAAEGDPVEVFVYKDSQSRPIATTRHPYLLVGETGKLKVRDMTRIGAFLDIGLERDVLLPFKEMQGVKRESGSSALKPGDEVLAALYVDHSGRLAATMRVYPYLKRTEPGAFEKDAEVQGTVYGTGEPGVFVAVEDRYFGLIPASEVYETYRIGQTVTARVMRVREDLKLDLSLRKKAYQQMEDDAERIRAALVKAGGSLPYGDHSDPEEIRRVFGLSKNAFKRAVGQLLKNRQIELTKEGMHLLPERRA